MRFADYAKIYVTAGKGGDGSAHFRREKFVPRGGPDGGDGGKGGSIILNGNQHLNTLLDLRYKKYIKAKRGEHGAGSRKTGAGGTNVILDVPLGTVAYDAESRERIGEITENEEQLIIAEGGKGGLGNWHFKSATNQTPQFAQEGKEGEERIVELELKLIADVGLVGFPNAGKSTLLAALSEAKPKIADYPFTTLEPNLGVVKFSDYRSFVMADIPGIIEEAHQGKGLGIQFLRHIERNNVLLFMVAADTDIKYEYTALVNELKAYRSDLLRKPRILAITKMDLKQGFKLDEELHFEDEIPVIPISSATGFGVDELRETLWGAIQNANNSSLRNLIALSLIPGFGPKRVKNLLVKFPDASRLFKLSKSELRSVEGIGEASALTFLSFDKWEEVDEIIEATEKVKASILTIADDFYPNLLKQIYDPPVILWYKGNPDVLNKPGVAVVGTRNTTSYGKKTAKRISTELSESGLCINSGLAYGIDSIAHQAAVDAGGKTIAVLGSGIDWIYPAKNKDLANAIVKSGGIVISEFPPKTKPDAGNFPVRNRIVSGLSYGTLVVESAIQGGSIITAELALDQNREVFAIPHSNENLNGSGCNYLIKTGAAKLVQTVDDILEELPLGQNTEHRISKIEQPELNNWRDKELDDLSQRICTLLEEKEYQIDALADELGASTSQLLVAILTLEMKQVVTQKAGKIFELNDVSFQSQQA